MRKVQQAKVAGHALHCPVCNQSTFYAQGFYPQSTWLQVFDLLPFSEEGLMLICEHCSNILYFARHSSVELDQGTS